jgi:hypothetical protein
MSPRKRVQANPLPCSFLLKGDSSSFRRLANTGRDSSLKGLV